MGAIIRESGDNWFYTADNTPSIDVIEPVRAAKKGKRAKGKRKARKVPFGFARALPGKRRR